MQIWQYLAEMIVECIAYVSYKLEKKVSYLLYVDVRPRKWYFFTLIW